MSLKQTIAKFLKLSLLFLFVGYYSGITLFYHVHIVNGQAIVHSHFYKSESDSNKPVKKHSHPISAYDLIHQLNKINCEELIVFGSYQQPLLVAQSIIRFFSIQNITTPTNFHLPSRAPPRC
jgi:hypothetical protein